jgi:hypothetical protein
VPGDAEILDVLPTHIRLRIAKRSGTLVERWMEPEHLVPAGWPPHLPFVEELGETEADEDEK